MCYTKHLPDLIKKQGGACHYCGTEVKYLPDGNHQKRYRRSRATTDHVIARHNGGSNDITNLVAACNQCNSAKGSLDYKEFLRILNLDDVKFGKFLQINRNAREKNSKRNSNKPNGQKKSPWEIALKSIRKRRKHNLCG